MRQYHSDNKNYNAILDAMAQIRQNQLNESYGYYAEEDDEEQMQEAMHGDEEEEMQEGHGGDITPEEAEELGALIDDVLAEEFEEDDLNESISLEEADKNKKSKVRSFLKGVALAGLLGAGTTAAAYGLGTDPGRMSAPGAPVRTGMQRALSRIGSGYATMGQAGLTGVQAAGRGVSDAASAANQAISDFRDRKRRRVTSLTGDITGQAGGVY